MSWDPDDEVLFPDAEDLGELQLVYAKDVCCYKVVNEHSMIRDMRYSPEDLIVTDGEYGVLIAEGEPVTKQTIEMLAAAGITWSIPVRLTHKIREAI